MPALLFAWLVLLTTISQTYAAGMTSSMIKSADDARLSVINSSFIVPPDEMPTPSCHGATLVETASGELMAAWFGGSEEGAQDVRIWGANYRDGQWYPPVQLTQSLPDNLDAHWNPVLFHQDGLLYLHFKVGKSPRSWQGYYQLSTDQGDSWSAIQAQPPGFLGPIRNKPLILPGQRTIHPSSTEHQGWHAHLEVHDQQEITRVTIADPLRLGAIQPALLHHCNGVIQALCRTRSGVVAQSFSHDRGDSWSELKATSLPNPNSAIEAITLRNGQHLLVYNPVVAGRSPLVVALSDDGQTWHHQLTLEDGEGEFSYPTVIEGDNGTIHIAYTWQRRAIRHVELGKQSEAD